MDHLRSCAVHLCLAMGMLLAMAGCQLPAPTVSPLLSVLPTLGADDIDEVTIHVTPGFGPRPPDLSKPAEQITARRIGAAYELRIGDNTGSAYREVTAPLTRAEWLALVSLIQELNIFQFTPQEAGRAIDHDVQGFAIRGTRTTVQVWTTILVDERPYNALRQYLGQLAQDKIPQVRLKYLRPG